MRLAELFQILAQREPSAFRELAEEASVPLKAREVHDPYKRSEVAEILASRLLARLEERGSLESLDDRQLQAIRAVASCPSAVLSTSWQLIERIALELKTTSAAAAGLLEQLQSVGILFLLPGDSHYPSALVIPDEVLLRLLPRVLGVWRGRLDKRLAMPVHTRHDHLAAESDLFHLVARCAAEPLRVTMQGQIYKRDLKDLFRLFRIPEAVSDQFIPLRLLLLLRLAHRMNLLEHNRELRQFEVGRTLDDWLGLTWQQRVIAHRLLWLQEIVGLRPRLRLFLLWLAQIPVEQWVSVGSLLRFDEELDRRSPPMHPAGGVPQRGDTVEMLANAVYLGLAEIGTDEEPAAVGGPELMAWYRSRWLGVRPGASRPPEGGDLWLRLTAMGRSLLTELRLSEKLPEEEHLFVQPNFEVLVPPFASFRIRWQLSTMAEPVKLDEMSVYRLTSSSVLRALRRGSRVEALLRFLEQHSRNPVPQNVAFALTTWCQGWGQATILQATLLQVSSEELVRRIVDDPVVGPLILGQLAPTLLLIPAERIGTVRQRLEQIGFPQPDQLAVLDSREVAAAHGFGLPSWQQAAEG